MFFVRTTKPPDGVSDDVYLISDVVFQHLVDMTTTQYTSAKNSAIIYNHTKNRLEGGNHPFYQNCIHGDLAIRPDKDAQWALYNMDNHNSLRQALRAMNLNDATLDNTNYPTD